jgi:hypothetical protein
MVAEVSKWMKSIKKTAGSNTDPALQFCLFYEAFLPQGRLLPFTQSRLMLDQGQVCLIKGLDGSCEGPSAIDIN